MSTHSPAITLALIARNEEQHIGRCLESASALHAEVIVVDTGSCDRTKEIAIAHGARVYDFEWKEDFSAARNRALEDAHGRWILVLDADEYLPPESVEAILKLTAEGTPADRAYHLLNKSSSDGGRTGTAGQIVRLFPNHPCVRYEWPVHEQVVTSLQAANIPIEDTQIEIIHTGYSSPEVNAAKQERNLRILDRMTSDSSENGHPMAWFLRGGALLDLKRPTEALASYHRCAEMTRPGETLHEAALVRSASCFAETKSFQEIRGLQPAGSEESWHPELLLLRGQAEIALGNVQAGLAFLHLVFEAPGTPRIPAYDPTKTRARAMIAIASLWETSNPARAVEMLRTAATSLTTGSEITLAEALALQQM